MLKGKNGMYMTTYTLSPWDTKKNSLLAMRAEVQRLRDDIAGLESGENGYSQEIRDFLIEDAKKQIKRVKRDYAKLRRL